MRDFGRRNAFWVGTTLHSVTMRPRRSSLSGKYYISKAVRSSPYRNLVFREYIRCRLEASIRRVANLVRVNWSGHSTTITAGGVLALGRFLDRSPTVNSGTLQCCGGLPFVVRLIWVVRIETQTRPRRVVFFCGAPKYIFINVLYGTPYSRLL